MRKDCVIELSHLRREDGRSNLMAFAKHYFSHLMKLPSSGFHRETAGLLVKVARKRNGSIALAAPRGHAKSTLVSLAYPLWAACYGHERCIVLFSGTERMARDLLEHIAREIRTNKFLRADFPEVIGSAKCRRDRITTGDGILIAAGSVGQEVRGLRGAKGRPSLVIADDVEMTEHFPSPEGRERVREWFLRTVQGMGDGKANYIVAGTIHHQDALMAHLTAPDGYAGWTKKVYPAVRTFAARQDLWDQWRSILSGRASSEEGSGRDAAEGFFLRNREAMLEGAEVLWPEGDSYYDLMLYIETRGESSFYAEKQNNPVDPEKCCFPRSRRSYWDDRFHTSGDLWDALKGHFSIVAACDPATGDGRDNSAIVVAFLDHRDKKYYVVHAQSGKWGLSDLTQRIMDIHKAYPFHHLAFESNGYQSGWARHVEQEAQKERRHFQVEKVVNSVNKEQRIRCLEPHINSGRMLFQKRDTDLHTELDHFPKGRNDDLVDALRMLVDIPVEDEKKRIDDAFRLFCEWNRPRAVTDMLYALDAFGNPVEVEEGWGWLLEGGF